MGAVHMDFLQFLHYHLNGPYLIWEISPCGQPWWSLRTKYTLTWIFFNSFIIWEISPCFNSFVIILSGKSHLVVNLGGNCFVASSHFLPLQWPNSQSHLKF